jgi:thiol-disulfide isomerase/thioredoxin
MANGSDVMTKRERRRRKAEELRAAQHRREQRRTIGYTLAALAVVVIAVGVIAGVGGGTGGAGGIQPSAQGQISVSGAARSSMFAVGDSIPAFSAPGFHMQDDGGTSSVVRERIDWSSYAGSPTVLAVWAPWCPHCQAELPVLSAAVAKDPGVRLVGVVTSIGQHPGPAPNEYLAGERLTFPSAIDDENGTLARALGVQAFPTLYLVGSDGKVAYASEGEVPPETLQQELSSLS